LPSQSFFWFCEELLERYKDDEQIFSISGSVPDYGSIPSEDDYSYSIFPNIWGWATCRRVWKHYDVSISEFPNFQKNNTINTLFKSKILRHEWLDNFSSVYTNKIDTWDFQFIFLSFFNHAYSIQPKFNLISNIGFGAEATHTLNSKDSRSNMKKIDMKFPILHPQTIKRNTYQEDGYLSQLPKKTILKKYLKLFMKRY
jgi:hypothetical protein